MQIRGSRPRQFGQRPYKPKPAGKHLSPLFLPTVPSLLPTLPQVLPRKESGFRRFSPGVLSCYEHSYLIRWFCSWSVAMVLRRLSFVSGHGHVPNQSCLGKIKKQSPRDVTCSTALSFYPGPEGHMCYALQRKSHLQLNHCNKPPSLPATRLGSPETRCLGKGGRAERMCLVRRRGQSWKGSG